MNRRAFLLSFAADDSRMNTNWQAFVKAANTWSSEWNAMARDAGTVSIGEYKAWKEMEETFKQLREERKRQMEGK